MVIDKGIDDIESLVDEVIDVDSEQGISFIGKYETASTLIKELLGYLDIAFIEFYDEEEGYDKEYIISIYDGKLFCEKFYRDTGYICPDDGVVFLLPDCSDDCLDYISGFDRVFISTHYKGENIKPIDLFDIIFELAN